MKNKNSYIDTSMLVGLDSTSIDDLLIAHPIGETRLDQSTENAVTVQDEASSLTAEPSDPIKDDIELARIMASEYNLLINRTAKELAERAIELGKVLVELKSMVKKPGVLWSTWADENLPFIAERNREKYMMLARRKDCHPYTYLGVDRLEMLCSATKGIKEADPIGSLLRKYSITINDTSENSLSEFKLLIDTALNMERLEKASIAVDFALVKRITEKGETIDSLLLGKLRAVRQSNGNPQIILESLAADEGTDEEPSPEKRLQDFNSLSNKLIKTVDYILAAPDQIPNIHKDSFLKLLQKLVQLQAAGNITEDDEAEATEEVQAA
jgi:hypothetical protein